MTHHDLISSYIDNELTREQEQEFLISLAANENLRGSFRTELTLKNIVHRDESLIRPPHALRNTVFAAIGIAGTAEAASAATVTSSATTSTSGAVASQSSAFFKGLFATKVNALFTTLTLSMATLIGFVGNDLLDADQPARQAVQTPVQQNVSAPAGGVVTNEVFKSEAIAEEPVAKKAVASKPNSVAPTNSISSETDKTSPTTEPSSTSTSGTGEIDWDVKINSPK